MIPSRALYLVRDRLKEKYMTSENCFAQYFETALWAETNDDGDPLDGTYSIDDIDADFKKKSIKEIEDFLAQAERFIQADDLTDVLHDFWLTRNGHGAGFWDGDYCFGEELTNLAKAFGEVNLYVGDDGKIYG